MRVPEGSDRVKSLLIGADPENVWLHSEPSRDDFVWKLKKYMLGSPLDKPD
jgi:hypothetical protein